MPTVLKLAGLRVAIYPNDHRPPHVHTIGSGHEAVFELNCVDGRASLRENYGFPRRALTRIEKILVRHLAALCEAWESIHGIA